MKPRLQKVNFSTALPNRPYCPHKYAWQVQARDDADRDVFKNQGKSEVFVFQFGDLLGIPENLHKEGVNDQALTLAWEPAVRGETPALYHIRYKAASAESWSEILSDKQWVTLTGLKPNTDYEVQVRGKLDDVYSDYTPLLRAKTAEKAANFVCGQPPATVITDKTSRLLQLTPGDIFTCNDWRIVVREATRSTNGEFSGKGLMAVKMFAGASIEVIFHGAINAGYQLITGGVESTYKKGSEMGSVVEEMKKIGEKKKDTTKTNIDSLPLPHLQELAQALIDIHQERIDKAIVLNREEKQQINGARTKAKEALKTLNDPKATDKEKKEAEKNLRKAVADAKPAMDKLTNSDKDKQVVADRWFKNIMDFLNRYKGSNDDEKRQAEIWHHRMDSTVEVLSKKTNVPDSLMNAMLVAHQNAKTAWLNLEKGSDGKKRKGPSNDFDDGFTAEDITLCKKEVTAAEKVKEAIDIDWNCIFGWLDDCKDIKQILESLRKLRIENKVSTIADVPTKDKKLFGSFTMNNVFYENIFIVYYADAMKSGDVINPTKFVDNRKHNGFYHWSKRYKIMISISILVDDTVKMATIREAMRNYVFGEIENFEKMEKSDEISATKIKKYREHIKTLPESQRAKWYLELQKHVPYHSQLDNDCSVAKGYQMCNVTTLAMNFEALGVSNPNTTVQFEDNLGDKIGKPKIFYPKQWIKIAEQYGLKGETKKEPGNDKTSLMALIKPALENGSSISMSLYPDCKGHIVRVQGIDEGGLWIDDPNGNCPLACKLDRQKCKTGYDKGTRNSRNPSAGNNNYYPWPEIRNITVKYITIFSN